MKKVLILILSTLLLANCVMFTGCKKSNPIPNGVYVDCYNDEYQYTETADYIVSCIEVDNNKAIGKINQTTWFKCKIKTQGEQIFFEGYTWREIEDLFSKKYGSNFKWEVEYDSQTKTIKVIDKG